MAPFLPYEGYGYEHLGQREAFLALTIRELGIELEEGKTRYNKLMQDGELPFPEDAHEYQDSLMQLIERLKLERDRIALGAPTLLQSYKR